MTDARETMEFDVLIVGGGPAGLSAAIKIKQINPELSVCLIDKGAEIGAHLLSGAILDPISLNELIPDWKEKKAPIQTLAKPDRFMFLTKHKFLKIPHFLMPSCLTNKGNYIIRLGFFAKWLAEQAEKLGVEIYPGFAATDIIYNDSGSILGIMTGDMGLDKNGHPGPNYQMGVALIAKYTLFAEGSRGSLGKKLIAKFHLDQNSQAQNYSLGIKELWEVPKENFRKGLILHTIGWPLKNNEYGGSFMYHLEESLIAIGLVVGLDYRNPYLSPFKEFQKFKTHPHISEFLKGGKRLSYGARTLTTGGLQSLPKTSFPGGLLIGDNAGFLNSARIKGIHTAMKSGMLAAEVVCDAIKKQRANDELIEFLPKINNSWLYKELYQTRNFKPLLHKGLLLGSFLFAIDQILFRGKAPWTLHQSGDYDQLKPAKQCHPIQYPNPDGITSFDLPSSVFLSNTHHDENQPCHLSLIDPDKAIELNYKIYHSPEQYYCPAGVYEITQEAQTQQVYLQINASNCIHCKTCDIKDPSQNINWHPPQGGEGPMYQGM